ncbi:MAG: hypothetical protein ABR606_18255 [Vicinamibacterales bacterium]
MRTRNRVSFPIRFDRIAGGWISWYRDRIGPIAFSSSEGAFAAGAGVRARVTSRVLAGADFRVGWEPHCRVTGTIGVELGR